MNDQPSHYATTAVMLPLVSVTRMRTQGRAFAIHPSSLILTFMVSPLARLHAAREVSAGALFFFLNCTCNRLLRRKKYVPASRQPLGNTFLPSGPSSRICAQWPNNSAKVFFLLPLLCSCGGSKQAPHLCCCYVKCPTPTSRFFPPHLRPPKKKKQGGEPVARGYCCPFEESRR